MLILLYRGKNINMIYTAQDRDPENIDLVYLKRLEKKIDQLESLLSAVEDKKIGIRFNQSIYQWEAYDDIGVTCSSNNIKGLLKKIKG